MNITTLKQANQLLIEKGVVDFENMTVEGKQLLEVCGYSTVNAKARIDEQITKHGFEINKDFTISIVRDGNAKRNEYTFTMNAANHVLLAAMTEEGKAARQDAIDMKSAQPIAQTGDPVLDMLSAMAESRKSQLELEKRLEQQNEALEMCADVIDEHHERIEKFEQSAGVMQVHPANAEHFSKIRDRMSDEYGLTPEMTRKVLTELSYSPRPAGQVKNNHENAGGGTYTVWYRADVTKTFKRFASECERVTTTKCIHKDIEKRFKLVLKSKTETKEAITTKETPIDKVNGTKRVKALQEKLFKGRN